MGIMILSRRLFRRNLRVRKSGMKRMGVLLDIVLGDDRVLFFSI